jgi:transcriptional regulator GlxA family with amidase domain
MRLVEKFTVSDLLQSFLPNELASRRSSGQDVAMTFGFLIFQNVEELDFVGPWELVGTWGKFFGGPRERLVIAERAEPIVCANGLSINPHVDFNNCPKLDYLLVPGGQGSRREVDNPAFIDFIRRQAANCKAVLSVCTGSFLLQRAGMLDNKKATTHWGELPKLRRLPNIEVVEERIVRNGNVWIGAGVSAGTDLALAFIASEAGEEVAGNVQFFAEYYPSGQRYGRAHLSDTAPRYLKSS